MKINIGVFFGGKSVEHEISIISALQAISAFEKDKYRITPIYISKKGNWYTGSELLNMENYKNINELIAMAKKIYMTPSYNDFNIYNENANFFSKKILDSLDVAFPILHGTNGEDGALQGFFELKGIPYVGCDVLSSAVGMDKIMMKMILRERGLPTVDFCWFIDRDWYELKDKTLAKIEEIGFPVVIKPADLGSSVGISKVNYKEELDRAIELASSFSQRILVEKLVDNLREINCSVLGYSNIIETSVCEEPIKNDEILSYRDKYLNNSSKGMSGTRREIPAKLNEHLTSKIQSLALNTFKELGCSGVSRIDFLMDDVTKKIFINEINTIPGSLSFYLWIPSGKPFTVLLDELISLSFKKHRDKNNLITSYQENIFNIDTNSIKNGVKA